MAANQTNMTSDSNIDVLNTYLHPDALYNQPYEAVPVDLTDYATTYAGLRIEHRDTYRLRLTNDRACLLVEAWDEGTLRLRAHPSAIPGQSTTQLLGLIASEPTNPAELRVVESAQCIEVRTDHLSLTIDRITGDLTLKDARGLVLWQTLNGGVRFSQTGGEYAGHRFCCWSDCAKQRFYGFGGRVAPLDRLGQSVDVFSVKTGTEAGDYGGFPLPFFISTAGYGFFLNNPWPHVYFDMGRSDPAQWFVHAPGGECDIFLFAGPRFADVVERYTSLTGRVPAVPRWMLGFWCSSLAITTADQALVDARRLREESYPCDVLVFDGPWRGGPDFAAKYVHGHQYPSDDLDWHQQFGDGPAMVRQLNDLGIKTILHLNSRSFSSKTADEGVAKGLLRRHGEEVVPRLLDGTAEDYYRDLIRPRIDEEIAAWWTDHSDRVSGELKPGLPSRNLFGVLWNRLLFEQMIASGRPNRPSLSRGGGIGSQRYAIPWPGDTRCGLDGLADDIWFMLSAGLSGFALTSADLGGFVSRSSSDTEKHSPDALHAEMFDDENICRRLCQCLLYMPVPRIHNNCDTIAKFPWNCSPKAQRLYRQALDERYRLTPYLYSYILASSRTGLPLLRPLVYEHPEDADAIAATTEFYIGDWLLAAPVTEPNRSKWRVYLPAGQWTHLWSGCTYHGPTHVEVDAPLYETSGLPLFVRAGAIISRQDTSLHLADDPPKTLYLDIYPQLQSAINLHEGADVINRFTCDECDGRVIVGLQNQCDFSRRYVVRVGSRSQGVAVDMPARSDRDICM